MMAKNAHAKKTKIFLAMAKKTGIPSKSDAYSLYLNVYNKHETVNILNGKSISFK